MFKFNCSLGNRYLWRCMLEHTKRQVHKWKFYNMRCLVMFITAVCLIYIYIFFKGLFTWKWETPGRWGTAFTCNTYNPSALGWGYNLSLIRACSLSSCYLQSLLISFKGFSGSVSLSRPNSSKTSITKLNIGVSLCTSPTGPAQNPFHLVYPQG